VSQHVQGIWQRLLAHFEWLPDVGKNSLRADLIAAITGGTTNEAETVDCPNVASKPVPETSQEFF
jgi:hypothetical protein